MVDYLKYTIWMNIKDSFVGTYSLLAIFLGLFLYSEDALEKQVEKILSAISVTDYVVLALIAIFTIWRGIVALLDAKNYKEYSQSMYRKRALSIENDIVNAIRLAFSNILFWFLFLGSAYLIGVNYSAFTSESTLLIDQILNWKLNN